MLPWISENGKLFGARTDYHPPSLIIQDELHLTMLFISHDLPVIRQMCNRIVVLKNGLVCESNETESLFNNPQHDYTKQLIKLMPKIESLI